MANMEYHLPVATTEVAFEPYHNDSFFTDLAKTLRAGIDRDTIAKAQLPQQQHMTYEDDDNSSTPTCGSAGYLLAETAIEMPSELPQPLHGKHSEQPELDLSRRLATDSRPGLALQIWQDMSRGGMIPNLQPGTKLSLSRDEHGRDVVLLERACECANLNTNASATMSETPETSHGDVMNFSR